MFASKKCICQSPLSPPSTVFLSHLPTPSNWAPATRFSPTRYFVEEVVSRFDDADLHKTWIKVVAKCNSQERSSKMENMFFRIWHLARKKKQMEWDEARRRLELVKRSRDAAEDLSSEFSEVEKEKSLISAVESRTMSKLDSESRIWSPEEDDGSGKPNQLYIILISLHGLVHGENMELGRDSHTGGQVIPPGMDFSNVKAPEVNDGDGDLSALLGSDRSHSRRDFPQIWSEIMRFFTNPHKPMILALSGPDPKKNVTSLLKAFGESRRLRELANLDGEFDGSLQMINKRKFVSGRGRNSGGDR